MRRRVNSTMGNDEGETVTTSNSSEQVPRSGLYSVASYIPPFGVIAVLLGLYGLVYIMDNTLPKPLNIADEKAHPDAFITERARNDLKVLTNLGPRLVGSYQNEILAVEFLSRKIASIMQKAHKNQRIEVDVQVVSGSFYMGWKTHGAYSNLQNVVVKLHAANNATQSVLINAHFDSVPTSPGGSDDGINVAAMLEILRKLSKEPNRPLNNLVFLFNGAEETRLQAGHGFISKHKWAKDCKVVINLEAAGAGGKSILFQTGPSTPWLLKYYVQVPHPYGQVIGEEIFQSNVIPSDTDFRIFRDYGGLVGLDMAFFKNGYRYHTKYDDFEHIPLGSFQHVGDNVLSLVRSFGNAPEVANPKESTGKVVYFDFLGMFMISYTETVAYVINFIVALSSVVIFGLNIRSFHLGCTKQTIKYFILTFGAIIGGWIISIVFIILLAHLLDAIGYCMSWYGNPWLICGLFVAPTIGFSSILLPFVRPKNSSPNVNAQIQAHCVRIMWTMILFIGTILKIRAMYVLLILVLFNTLGFTAIYVLKLQHTVRKWQIVYVISLVIPTIFVMYVGATVLSLFVPITGRTGPDKKTDLTIGLISWFFTVLTTSPLVALSTLVRKFNYILIFLGVVFVISFIIIFTPLGFPYSGNPDSPTPKRYWILHLKRVFHDEQSVKTEQDSGYFLVNWDRNSPYLVKSTVKEITKAHPLREDCEKYLLCGVPFVGRFVSWVSAEQPILPEPIKLDVLSKVRLAPNTLLYNLSIVGPDRMEVQLSPRKDVKIVNISLIESISTAAKFEWDEREVYFIFHIYGKKPAPLQFTFTVEVPNNVSHVSTQIAVSGIYVHNKKNQKKPHFEQFLNEFPDWADVIAWLGSYESWWI